jgi:PAS domain S-box-containing protein
VDKRFNQIQEFIIQLASGNFEHKVTPSESLDELDALIVGINMLGEELKVSQEKHVALFEHAGDAILIFSTASNRFVDSNETATKLLGFSAEDIRLLSIVDLFPKEEKTSIESKVTYLKSVVQTNFDTQIETKAGQLKDVSFLSKRLPYGDDQYFQISLRDITESKQISNHLVKKNAELIKAQKEIGELSKFPSENPNPILRFNEKFILLYNNAASTINFHSDFKIKENKLNDRVLKDYLKAAKLKGSPETIIETRNKRHYSLTLVYVQEFNYINIYAADITNFINEVKEKEKSLIGLKDDIESQKEFYELILNSLPSDVAVFDKNHRYLFVNPNGIQDDITRKFMIGKDDFDYVNFKGISDEKAVVRRKLFKRIMRTKRQETWIDEFINKNGSRKVVQRSMAPILDEKGKFRFVIGYGTDITKRIQTEEENRKLSLVAKNTNNGVLMLNKNGEITWANTAFLERSGYSLSEIIDQNSSYYLLDERNESLLDKVSAAMNNQEKVSAEVVRRSKKGKEYWVDLNVQPLFDNANNISGFMFVEFDITDRIVNEQTIQNLNLNLENLVEQKTKNLRDNELKLENSLIKEKERTIALITSEKRLKKSLIKEKELGQLKASFVTVASHQFRTPLAVIQSNAELLEMLLNAGKKIEPAKYSKVNNRITSAISKMTDLMDDVLTLGKLTSGNVPYTPEDLDLVSFCKKMCEEFNSVQVDGRSLNVVTEGEPYMLELDVKLLEHTLSNLISNAFKYSRGKENPELRVHFKSKELVLSVKDFGLGIPEDQQLHLFEAFFRADNVTEIQGTGLGLSIAKEYVEVNKGTISAKSILGEGSCFEIIFKKDKL